MMRRAESLVLTHISRFSAGFIPVGIRLDSYQGLSSRAYPHAGRAGAAKGVDLCSALRPPPRDRREGVKGFADRAL